MGSCHRLAAPLHASTHRQTALERASGLYRGSAKFAKNLLIAYNAVAVWLPVIVWHCLGIHDTYAHQWTWIIGLHACCVRLLSSQLHPAAYNCTDRRTDMWLAILLTQGRESRSYNFALLSSPPSVKIQCSKPTACCLRVWLAHTSDTYKPLPPCSSSTAISSLAQNMCWWCWAFTPSMTRVPYSGASSPNVNAFVDSSPVSLISYLMVPSCIWQKNCRCLQVVKEKNLLSASMAYQGVIHLQQRLTILVSERKQEKILGC